MLIGIVGLAVELLLLEHWDDPWQWSPFVALGLGLASGGALLRRPTPGRVRAFRAVMALFVVTGAVGVLLHYRGNAEFEVEQDPAVRGLALVWLALRGATPALAPGALAHLGLIGLLATWGHPALAGARDREATDATSGVGDASPLARGPSRRDA